MFIPENSFFCEVTLFIKYKFVQRIGTPAMGYGYFIVKTALLSPFSSIKWPHGRPAENCVQLWSDQKTPKVAESGWKWLKENNKKEHNFYVPHFDFIVNKIRTKCIVVRPLSVLLFREKFGVIFFSHLAISFGSGAKCSKYYSMTLPQQCYDVRWISDCIGTDQPTID